MSAYIIKANLGLGAVVLLLSASAASTRTTPNQPEAEQRGYRTHQIRLDQTGQVASLLAVDREFQGCS